MYISCLFWIIVETLVKSTTVDTQNDNQKSQQPNPPHPLTPINDAYLEHYKRNELINYNGRNLKDEIVQEANQDGQIQSNRYIESLECDEELEIEQAREEIASMESQIEEIKIPNNSLNDPNPEDLNQKTAQSDFDQQLFKTFYKNFKPDGNESFILDNDVKNNIAIDSNTECIIGNEFINQFNPITKTFFKCSIYSPSYRLYTVDEVNSVMSDNEISSQFKFSNKNQDSVNMTSFMVVPMTPTPKISKVMSTRKIRTKTDKQSNKMNMTVLGPSKENKAIK